MIKNNLLTKILIILGLAFSVSTFVSADRTANGVPGDGVIGQVLQSLGGGESIWVATSSLGIVGGTGTSTGWTFSTTTIWDLFSATYPIQYNSSTGVFSTGFSTSTINSFSAKQTFTNASSTSFTADTLYSTTGIFTKANITNASNTAQTLTGYFYDSTSNSGTNGQYLQSTGTSTLWSTISGFVTNAYASSTFVTYPYASSTFPSYPYASSTYVAVVGNQTIAGNKTFSGNTSLSNASATALTVSDQTVLATTTVNGDFTLNGGVITRTVNYTASTSVTINTDTTDIVTIIVAYATTTFNTPTGTLWNGKMFEIMLTATTTRGLAWSTGFASSTDLAIPITTASGTAKYLYEYRSQSGKWELNGLLTGFIN